MALSQKGAQYRGRDGIANPPDSLKELSRRILEATDDLASQVQAVRTQGNFGQAGSPTAPHPLTSIAVSAASGFATVNLVHANAPAGSQYVIEYSTTPNFQPGTIVQEDNGISLSYQKYLHGQTLYFRAAPKFPASPLAPWIYFGGQANPTAVTF